MSASSAIRWQALRRAGGDGRSKPQGGDRLSRRTDAHAGLIDAVLAFETSVAKVLVPELAPGDIVVMDNLSSHKGRRVRALIEAAGASRRYLPPSSPDFNPIEMAFAMLKALLPKAAERTVEGLRDRIGCLIDAFTADECANYFEAEGYNAS